MDAITATDAVGASAELAGGAGETLAPRGTYTLTCVGADGEVKWTETIHNTVVTVGKNDLLDDYLSGVNYTAAWYIGLVDGASTPTYAAANTMSSHSGWTESTAYSNSTRVAATFAAASAGSKATSTTSDFNMNATATIAGSFLTNSSTKGGTTGILFSVGSFSGGNRSVLSGDVLKTTYSLAV